MKWIDIVQDYLRTGTMIGSCVSHEHLLRFLVEFVTGIDKENWLIYSLITSLHMLFWCLQLCVIEILFCFWII